MPHAHPEVWYSQSSQKNNFVTIKNLFGGCNFVTMWNLLASIVENLLCSNKASGHVVEVKLRCHGATDVLRDVNAELGLTNMGL